MAPPRIPATRLTRLDGALAVDASCADCGSCVVAPLEPRPILATCSTCGLVVEIDAGKIEPTRF